MQTIFNTVKRHLFGHRDVVDMSCARANEAALGSRSRANSASRFVATGDVERVTENGNEWLKTPGVIAKEGIYTYPDPDGGVVREYLPGEELEKSADGWEGTPILLDHPTDDNDIATVIARGNETPAHIGEIRSPETIDDGDTKLKAESWLDLSNAGEHDGAFDAIVSALEDRDGDGVVETSGAYQTNRANETGFFDGQHYDGVQRPILPDHVAAFSPESGKTGNCSVASGCGIGRANADEAGRAFVESLDGYVHSDDRDLDAERSIGRRAIEALGLGDVIGRSNGDAQQSDEPAESGTGNGDTSTMKDEEKITKLVENHGFDQENMDPLEGTDCLEQIYTKFAAESQADGGNGSDDPEPSGGSDDVGAQVADAVANELSELKSELSEIKGDVKAQKEEKRDRAAEILAEKSGIDAENITVSAEKADEVLAEHRANEASAAYGRANMAGANVATGVGSSGSGDAEEFAASVRDGNERFGGD